MNDYDTMFTSEAICPYCGWVNYDSWECGDECVEQCPECNNSFDQERNVSITYSTKKIGSDVDE